jgi:decaprenyl-phosphate phosphoribosyltransferase
MPEKIRLYLQALRLERWPRSLAILPGAIAVLALHRPLIPGIDVLDTVLRLCLAFVLTWFVSTANYIINEITDAPFDAFHPLKKSRPLVKGEINRSILLLLWLMLVGISLLIAHLLFNFYFLLSLLGLLVAGLLYNVPPVRVKDIPLLDSTIESANNPIRFLIGWYILKNSFPPLTLLAAWWVFGNFLMVGKRVAEKKFLTEEESAGYRRSLKRSGFGLLVAFMIFNALLFLVFFSLFAVVSRLHSFLYSLPLIVIYLAMFMKKSLQDREGAEEPEKLLKNPYFAGYTLFLAIIFVVAYIFG